MTTADWWKLLLPLAIPLALAALAYFDFFRRRKDEERVRQEEREYALVRTRYLDEGLDELIANIQSSLSAYQRNWTTAIAVLKLWKDRATVDEGVAKGLFPALSMAEMQIRPIHRVRLLIGDDIIWILTQHLSAFLFSAHFDIQHDLAGGISQIEAGKINLTVSKAEAVAQFHRRLQEVQNRSNNYFAFLSLLHKLSTEFEREQFTFRSIAAFQKRPAVADIVERLKEVCDSIEREDQARRESART